MVSRTERRNLAAATAEAWRPPLFTRETTRAQRLASAVRRYFDLQAGSIWADLKQELAEARGTVLDVGCGAQPYRSLVPPQACYVAIDTIDAKERFGYEVAETLYFSGEVWPVETASVELVLCAEVLEHIAEPVPFLAEARRCLRSAGRIVIVVPFSARWHFIPHDYYRFTPSGLTHVLHAAGFSKISIHARGNPLTVACQKCMALLLPLLFADRPGALTRALLSRLLGVAALPVLTGLAVLANLTMRRDWGEDCLGYTVIAQKGQ